MEIDGDERNMVNVLVFPGGTEIGLEINKSLRYEKNINLFAAGDKVSNHAPYVYSCYDYVPPVYHNGWFDYLLRVVEEHNIDYIYPAHDSAICTLRGNADRLSCKVIAPSLEVCSITRSKVHTYEKLAGVVPIPDIYHDFIKFPVFIKPDIGQGSVGARVINNLREASEVAIWDNVIMEYLPGLEWTIDCFTNRHGEVTFCSPRTRDRTRAGISMASEVCEWQELCDEFKSYAEKINKVLPMIGAWFFQMKDDRSAQLKLLEVAPRIAGTMAVNRCRGINFPLLTLYEHMGIDTEIMLNNYHIKIDRALVNRYESDLKYSAVFVDLDDTLIVKDKVNTDLIKFIYQCFNKNVLVYLITRNANAHAYLLKCHIDWHQFEDCFSVSCNSDVKAEIIQNFLDKGYKPIFIDDSFAERKVVAEKCGISTFDCSMLEMLMDDRT